MAYAAANTESAPPPPPAAPAAVRWERDETAYAAERSSVEEEGGPRRASGIDARSPNAKQAGATEERMSSGHGMTMTTPPEAWSNLAHGGKVKRRQVTRSSEVSMFTELVSSSADKTCGVDAAESLHPLVLIGMSNEKICIPFETGKTATRQPL